MTDGRTIWWPKDSAWWRREYIVALGEEFGADGPAVLDWLSCEAKAQNDGGNVKAGIRTCSRGTFVDAATVSHVLSRAVTLGALHDLEEDDGRFRCRISGWAKDNDRGRAAVRQAKRRSTEPKSGVSSRAVTPGHGASRSVTPSSIQESREEGTPPISPSSEEGWFPWVRSELPSYADSEVTLRVAAGRCHALASAGHDVTVEGMREWMDSRWGAAA